MKIFPKQLAAYTGIAALSTIGLFAASNTQKPMMGQDRFVTEVEAVLAMTPDQKDQAQTAFQEARQAAQPVRNELTNTDKALQTAVRSGDTAQVQRLSTTLGQEIGQLVAIRSTAFTKIYKTLTPEQKTRADALQQLLMQGMRQQMDHSRRARTAS